MLRIQILSLPIACCVIFTGCAEGPLWKMGGYFPWVQSKWQAEEQVAETIHAKKAKLRKLANSARHYSSAQKEEAIQQLALVVQNERIVQLRVEAAYSLGELNTQSAEALLGKLLNDPDAEVRIAALNALSRRNTETASREMIRVLQSDTDKDVRATAIRNLAKYPANETLVALSNVLDEPEPALQYRAMKSLKVLTNEGIGFSVPKWKNYLASKGIQSNRVANQAPAGSKPSQEPF